MQNSKKRLFTQRELEKHINARLMRERKKNDDLEALKRMMDELMESGKIDADSYAEAGQRLMELLAGNRMEKAYVKDEAENAEDTDKPFETDDTQAITDETSENVGETEVDEEQRAYDPGEAVLKSADSEVPGEPSEVVTGAEVHTETESGELGQRLAKLCSELARVIESSLSGNKGCRDIHENTDDGFCERRAASSTGFSARSASDTHTSGFELTPMQRDIARRAGISYKEYAGLLREIPENIKKRKSYR